MIESSLSTVLLLTALIIILSKLIIYHYKRLDLYRAGNKIPGPHPVLPIIGNAHLFFGKPEDLINKVMILLDNFNKLSPVRVWLGHKLCIVISDPEQMKTVFYSPKTLERDDMMKFLYPWLGTGLLTAPTDVWRVRRKLIMPAFNQKILESFIDTMNKQSETLVKILESEINRDEFDIFSYISPCTLDTISETAMGVTANEQMKRNSDYAKALEKIMKILYQRMVNIWLHPDIIFNLTQLARDQAECIEYLHKYTNDVITQKQQQFSSKINDNDDFTPTKIRRKAFLDLLIEVSEEETKLTNKQLREEVDTAITAANNTSAIVISFIILMLANFPKIQEKCYKELEEIFGDKINKKKIIDNEDLTQMEYLGRVIKETMRLFPAAPLIVRQVSDDLKIEGYTLPKGSTVVLAVLKLHRSADIWKDPLSFNPDRFLPEEVVKRHPCAYVPFSLGPRNCIGLKYAMMNMKVTLATLLRSYVLIKDKHVNIEDIKFKSEIFIKTLSPITVKIQRRQIM